MGSLRLTHGKNDGNMFAGRDHLSRGFEIVDYSYYVYADRRSQRQSTRRLEADYLYSECGHRLIGVYRGVYRVGLRVLAASADSVLANKDRLLDYITYAAAYMCCAGYLALPVAPACQFHCSQVLQRSQGNDGTLGPNKGGSVWTVELRVCEGTAESRNLVQGVVICFLA